MNFSRLPEFCRVVALAKPVEDSAITIEIWMPSPGKWSGRFQGTGKGGYASNLEYSSMALEMGDATAGTDTGHTGGDLKFAVGHPERIVDWGYRAIHVMTETAKLVIRDYTGRFPNKSYFNSCSTGGGQGLSEAQRFPSDYNGILAGDPGNYRVDLNAGFLWAYAADHAHPDSSLDAAALKLLHNAAIAACDANDGVHDSLISDPLKCHFNPAVLECKQGESANCLTRSRVQTARAIYEGPRADGQTIFPGYEPGSEVLSEGGQTSFLGSWHAYLTGLSEPRRVDFWKYWVFNDPLWDWRTFDYRRDVDYADVKVAAANATNPHLEGFAAGGGKLMIYQGWADPVVPPRAAIEYVNSVAAHTGRAGVDHFLRLFLVPGMGHCGGGYGPLPTGNQVGPEAATTKQLQNPDDTFLAALERRVEKGVAPQRILASQTLPNGTRRTRPICPYPLVVKWTGKGSTNDASNFVCRKE
jgi:Tannase and feruloyl esterase